MIKSILIVLMLSLSWPSHASGAALPDITEKQALNWKWIDEFIVTPDGRWFAYLIGPGAAASVDADSYVVLRNLASAQERRYRAGRKDMGAGNLKISNSGQWVAFQMTAQASTGPRELSIALVDVRTGELRTYPGGNEFEFSKGRTERLVFKRKIKNGEPEEFEIIAVMLGNGHEEKLGPAFAYAISPIGTDLTWADKRGLHVTNLDSGKTESTDNEVGAIFRDLVWSQDGGAIAAIRELNGATRLITIAKLAPGAKNDQWLIDPQECMERADERIGAQTPMDAPISVEPSLQWRHEGDGLYFDVTSRSIGKTETSAAEIVIWNSRDTFLAKERKMDEVKPRKWSCFASIESRKVIQISSPDSRIAPAARGHLALGYSLPQSDDHGKNRSAAGSFFPQTRNYFLIDLATGMRTVALPKIKVVTRSNLSIEPRLSPAGTFLLYQNESGDYISRSTENGVEHNLTSNLPDKFYFPENDPKNGEQPRDSFGQGGARLQGWSKDGAYVLISDFYDVWALPLKGGKALNLTRDGRARQIAFSIAQMPDRTDAGFPGEGLTVDLDESLYFQANDLITGKTGLYRLTPYAHGLQELHVENASTRFYKARDADVFLFSRETAIESMNFYKLSKNWKAQERLTDANPQQSLYRWSAGAKYLNYKNARGERRNAILYLPAGYASGKAYPTIVSIYTGQSGSVHSYIAPFYAQRNIDQFLRAGYAYLAPDIQPRFGQAGQAAVEDVTAAVEASVATGIVDGARLGLTGHSYGAYETLFIVSQTNKFLAAAPMAGMSNLWSFCGGIYSDSWLTTRYCDSDQPYLGGPWWENWDSYITNSPLYHAKNITTPLLLVHGDQDDAVQFSQSVELYSALHGLGNQSTVLLEYVGENHDFGEATHRDLNPRMIEFFNHFLKGDQAPAWWAEGVSGYQNRIAPVTSSGTSH